MACPLNKNIVNFKGVDTESNTFKSISNLLNSNDDLDLMRKAFTSANVNNALSSLSGIATLTNLQDLIVSIKKKQHDSSLTGNMIQYTQDEETFIKSTRGNILLQSFNDKTGEINIDLMIEITKEFINSGATGFTAAEVLKLSEIYGKLKYGIAANGGYRNDLEVDPVDETRYISKNGETFLRASSFFDQVMGRKSFDDSIKETYKAIAKEFEDAENLYTNTGTTPNGFYIENKNNKIEVFKESLSNGSKKRYTLQQAQDNAKNYKKSIMTKGRLYHAYIEEKILMAKLEAVNTQEQDSITKSSIIQSITDSLKINKSNITKYKKELSVLENAVTVIDELQSSASLFMTDNMNTMIPGLYVDNGSGMEVNPSAKEWLFIDTEKTLAINSKVYSETGEYDGFGSTLDIVISKTYNGKRIYTIIDAKSGSSDSSGKGSKIKGTNYKNNQDTINKLKLVFNAVMLKATDPEASIEELILSSVNDGGDVNFSNKDLMPEFKQLLGLLESQLMISNKDFVMSNKNLFSIDSYFVEPEVLRKEREFLLKSNFSLYSDEVKMKEKLKEIVDSKVKELSSTISKNLKSSISTYQESQQLNKYIQAKSYIETGKRYLNNTSVSFRQKLVTHASQSDNQFVQFFYRTFEKANTSLNKYAINASNEISQSFSKVFSNKLSVLAPDYKELYGDLFDTVDTPSTDPSSPNPSYKNYELKNYTNKSSWNEFVNKNRAKAEFADDMRFKIRFQYYKTMNPKAGIGMIESELKARNNSLNGTPFLNSSHESLLLQQIEELKSMNQFNKFKEEEFYKYKDVYKEGWFPSYRLSKDSNQTMKNSISNMKAVGLKESLSESFVEAVNSFDADPYINKDAPLDLPDSGMHVNWFNKRTEEDFDNEYSLNFPQAVFEFLYSMERKIEYDRVYHLGVGIVNMFTANDAKGNENVIEFLKNQLLVNVRGQKKKVLGSFPTINGNEISADNITMAATTLARWKAMSLNIIGGVASSTVATIVLVNKAINNSLLNLMGQNSSKINGTYVYDTNDVTWEYLKAMLSGTYAYALSAAKYGLKQTGDNKSLEEFYKSVPMGLDNEKLELISREIGFTPDAIQKIMDENNFNIQPMLSFKNAQEVAFWSYKVIDTINYNAVLLATLKSMKIKGTQKSLFDAYKVENGKLVWDKTIPARGVDSETGELMYGLTTKEIQSLKFMTTKFMGSMRPEEKTAMDSNTMLSLLSTFKRFIPGILDATISAGNEESSLGYYLETGQVDENGLPMYKWIAEADKGSLTMVFDLGSIGFDKVMTLLKLSKIAKNDKIGFNEYFDKLSTSQKRALSLLATNLLSSLSFWFFIMQGFKFDEDDEEDMMIKKFIDKNISGMTSTMSPFLVTEYLNAPVPEILKKSLSFFMSLSKDYIEKGEISEGQRRSLNDNIFFDPLVTTKQEQQESEDE